MQLDLRFCNALFVLMALIISFGVSCSDDSEKPKIESDIGVDASGEDVIEGTDVLPKDVREDVSSSDVGGKLETGEECPERCVVDEYGLLRCSECSGDWCLMDSYTLQGDSPYCTQPCVSSAECDAYGEDWVCGDSYKYCLRSK